MNCLVRGSDVAPIRAILLALAVWGVSGSIALAQQVVGPVPKKAKNGKRLTARTAMCAGQLGYGPPGTFPGFYGFALAYHLGYGYGGVGLGTGPYGGYPFYGGPGYPHPWPELHRIGAAEPFPYFAGPGGPTPGQPNFFGVTSPLAGDQPVVTILSDNVPLDHVGDYGCFTGTLPYPESFFAPFTNSAAMTGTNAVGPPAAEPPTPPNPGLPPGGASATPPTKLGIDSEVVLTGGNAPGLKVSRVYAQTAAEKAGLHPGDVIRSINGFQTKRPSDLAWIIANASPARSLTINVQAASDGALKTLTARIP